MPAATTMISLILPVATALVASAPVPPVIPLRITATFEAPSHAWSAGHRGIDVAADTDQPVASLTPGRIGFAGRIAGKAVLTVVLADGRRVTYEPVHSDLVAGTPVHRGQLIGTVAASGGHCGGDAGCLHIGLRSDTDYFDPMALLGRPPVLKPLSRGGSWPSARP